MEVIHCGTPGTSVPSYSYKWKVATEKIRSDKALRSSQQLGYNSCCCFPRNCHQWESWKSCIWMNRISESERSTQSQVVQGVDCDSCYWCPAQILVTALWTHSIAAASTNGSWLTSVTFPIFSCYLPRSYLILLLLLTLMWLGPLFFTGDPNS